MCARSLSEASGMLSARRFDLVILDLGLPDGDGRTLLEGMPQPSPPILILSQRELAPDATRPFAAALLKSSTDAPKLQRFIDMVLRASPRTVSASTRDSRP
jgi:DNA-binding response OmpR family regulator